ncbi:MAG: hypothetical protein IPG71_04060 [bacterium]|nr:hypothetical protein [bacterium]
MKLALLFACVGALAACSAPKVTPLPKLTGTWFANAQSVGYLNLQRMALELRADSSYRYYFRNAPTDPAKPADEFTEAGRYRVRGDSLLFTTEIVNGNQTAFDYARKYRMLPDTAEWPLRVTYTRSGIDFEVYFQHPK